MDDLLEFKKSFGDWFDDYDPYEDAICVVCRAPLPDQSRGRPRTTCSDRCRQALRRQSWEKWRTPREWDRDATRARRELACIERRSGPIDDTPPPDGGISLRRRIFIRLERGIEPSYCRHCHRPYIVDLPGASRNFCSRACTDAARSNRLAVHRGIRHHEHIDKRVFVRLRLDLPIGTCAHCGVPYPLYNPLKKFCSATCRKAHWRALHPTCPRCGQRFDRNPSRPTQRFCSDRCAKAAHKARSRGAPDRAPSRHPRPCRECGQVFTPHPQAPGSTQFCSPRCSRRFHGRASRARRKGAA